MDFPIHNDTISMGPPLCTLRGHRKHFLTYDVLLSQKNVLILTNSADPDEMQHYAAFHLGLHCLPKYPFMRFQFTKGFRKKIVPGVGRKFFFEEKSPVLKRDATDENYSSLQ